MYKRQYFWAVAILMVKNITLFGPIHLSCTYVSQLLPSGHICLLFALRCDAPQRQTRWKQEWSWEFSVSELQDKIQHILKTKNEQNFRWCKTKVWITVRQNRRKGGNVHFWGTPRQQYEPEHWLTASFHWFPCRFLPWSEWQNPLTCVCTFAPCGSLWSENWYHSPAKKKKKKKTVWKSSMRLWKTWQRKSTFGTDPLALAKTWDHRRRWPVIRQ